ncbi:DMT family transporter [Alphaproteobacteria bacterium LSUCC0684]
MSNLFCVLAALAWSFGFPAGTSLMVSWDLLSLLLLRLVPSTFLLIFFWWIIDGRVMPDRRLWLEGMIIGGIGFGFGTMLLLYGQQVSNPVTPAIAASMMPIMGAVLEVMLDGRRIRPLLVAGLICAIIGGLMAAGVRLQGYDIGVGLIWCLLATLLYAWATRATNKRLDDLSSMGQTAVTLAGAGVLIAVVWAFVLIFFPQEIRMGRINQDTLATIFAFSVLSAAISQPLWIAGARGLGVAVASFHLNAVPVYVMAIMVFSYGGEWDLFRLAGAVVVGGGVLLAQHDKTWSGSA